VFSVVMVAGDRYRVLTDRQWELLLPAADHGPARRPRTDVIRNRERILAAADRLLAEHGIEMTSTPSLLPQAWMSGRVYRQFANKYELIGELFVRIVDRIVSAAGDTAHIADPWLALTRFLHSTCEEIAGNRGFAAAVTA
jgi:AcrR family transcriptional regulator